MIKSTDKNPNAVICKKCGTEIDEDWNFCPYCEEAAGELTCAYCGRTIRTTWSYCPYCTKVVCAPKEKHVEEASNQWIKYVLYKG